MRFLQGFNFAGRKRSVFVELYYKEALQIITSGVEHEWESGQRRGQRSSREDSVWR